MTAAAAEAVVGVLAGDPPAKPSARRLLGLYLLLGFSAGLPFYMFNAVLTLRLARHGVDIVIIGFFAWIALLPTFKFAWAPLIERYDVPGFSRFWGRRRGWIMLSQLGIFLSMVAMAFTSSDKSLPLTALFAVVLAFWTTTLEVAADGWRIELAPTQAEQAPIVAANLWGYRSAMVAAGSGAILVAAWADWTWAYLVIAVAAFLPFPILAAMRPDQEGTGGRGQALVAGTLASLFVILAATLVTAVVGWALLSAAQGAGISAKTNVTPVVLAIALLPFVALALALPRIRRLPADALSNVSTFAAPYVELFWRYGTPVLAVLAFVSLYRMGDVLTLTLSHPLWNDKGYSLHQIGIADGVVALSASMLGVALGGFLSTRLSLGWTLGIGAVTAAAGNWIYVWLWHSEPSAFVLYTSVAVDQFGNGFAGAVFVVYLSMLVSPKYPGAQYALLSGFAFLLPRLLAGASGSMQTEIGYDGFFLLSGALSFAAIFLLPIIVRVKGRVPT
ncbi:MULTISPECIES: permease [unclassified Sphingopyxis]|uniref:permease n=1 Tax=unclassified Sphingopyxis TaxID=2614943 RepID=UPI00285E0086|nr:MULTISPECIES: permease [unclassified Sphingopyxis]MDR7058818.1 PAT family beta-lactamase induction signal transducer AmpG [Sphingopyxis sp. BE235]MDR7178996.1 PAT family beta-lactamase induction signal transducer AmpG [Sphingopyxis sp. BE249]